MGANPYDCRGALSAKLIGNLAFERHAAHDRVARLITARAASGLRTYTASEHFLSMRNRWFRLGEVINGGVWRPAEADYQVHLPVKEVARGCQIGGELVELAARLSRDAAKQ